MFFREEIQGIVEQSTQKWASILHIPIEDLKQEAWITYHNCCEKVKQVTKEYYSKALVNAFRGLYKQEKVNYGKKIQVDIIQDQIVDRYNFEAEVLLDISIKSIVKLLIPIQSEEAELLQQILLCAYDSCFWLFIAQRVNEKAQGANKEATLHDVADWFGMEYSYFMRKILKLRKLLKEVI